MNTADVSFSIRDTPLDGGGVLVTIHGELDIATAPALRERLTALAGAGVRRLVVDLRAVSFMDSTALAVLIHAKTLLGEEGRMPVVLAPDSYARLIVEVAGLEGVLDVAERLEDGISRAAL